MEEQSLDIEAASFLPGSLPDCIKRVATYFFSNKNVHSVIMEFSLVEEADLKTLCKQWRALGYKVRRLKEGDQKFIRISRKNG